MTPEWLEGHFATVFSRWHPQLVRLQRMTSDAIITAAAIRPGQTVLDIGSGSGVPALAVAEAVGSDGRVVATDPSPVFVAAVAANAHELGLANLRHLPPDPPASGPPPGPDAPRPTRFAEPDSLAAALTAAGFTDAREDAPVVDLVWPHGPTSLVQLWLKLTRLELRVAPDRHAALRADIGSAYERFRDGDIVRMPVRVVVASGRA